MLKETFWKNVLSIYMLYKNKQKPKKTELTLRVILTVVLILFVTDSTGGCIRCKVHNRTFFKFSVLNLGHSSSWDPRSPQYLTWTSFFSDLNSLCAGALYNVTVRGEKKPTQWTRARKPTKNQTLINEENKDQKPTKVKL